MKSSWYQNAIFYSLNVETFFDSDGDGVGDFQGLIQKLDYISGLGATCIWLIPFYKSSNYDNGYDVIDYYSVDPRYGTLGDFAEFVSKAQDLGIKVIIDLVVNHTSIEHPWFQEARKSKTSRYRNFYVWADQPLPFDKKDLMFTGEEETMWTYDELARQFYLHRFYKEQPDLNISNPEVQNEILKIIGFWLKLGIHGFRVDAAELLVENYGMIGVDRGGLITFINDMRKHTVHQKGDAILLAEVNGGPEKIQCFLEEERMHMMFNFYINQNFFLALAREDAAPLETSMKSLPAIRHDQQWLNFLRHHDELSLSLLSEEDRGKVFSKFAPDSDMQIYGRGIRRRLAPMLNNNTEYLEMCYSLMFSLPGTPMIRYGDEILMGDNLELPGRASVRTPMQWSEGIHGGFSSAAADKLVRKPVERGEFSYSRVNVLNAQRDRQSFLNWIESLISIRKQCPEIGVGELKLLPCRVKSVVAHCYEYKGDKMFFIHHLADNHVSVTKKEIGLHGVKLVDVFGCREVTQFDDRFEIKGYGYQWYRTLT
ncbi:MAG TPA: alpha-amylase family protein [Sphingobacteriaceae bacterium]